MNSSRLFLVVASKKTRVSGHKIEHGKFHLNMRKNIFEDDKALEQAAWGACGVYFSGDIQNPPPCLPV